MYLGFRIADFGLKRPFFIGLETSGRPPPGELLVDDTLHGGGLPRPGCAKEGGWENGRFGEE